MYRWTVKNEYEQLFLLELALKNDLAYVSRFFQTYKCFTWIKMGYFAYLYVECLAVGV